MATIHCKACGKSYNYEKNGCCPECGAYNRPPRREQVYADGTVHHLDGSCPMGTRSATSGGRTTRRRSASRTRPARSGKS